MVQYLQRQRLHIRLGSDARYVLCKPHSDTTLDYSFADQFCLVLQKLDTTFTLLTRTKMASPIVIKRV
jgi:hypothetical protein